MPTFSTVPLEQVRRQPATSQRTLLLREYQRYIELVGASQAGSLTLEVGETPQAR